MTPLLLPPGPTITPWKKCHLRFVRYVTKYRITNETVSNITCLPLGRVRPTVACRADALGIGVFVS